MFDRAQLGTIGMITLSVEHPRTAEEYRINFYVVAKTDQSILGFKACRDLKLIEVIKENACEVKTAELLGGDGKILPVQMQDSPSRQTTTR